MDETFTAAPRRSPATGSRSHVLRPGPTGSSGTLDLPVARAGDAS